MRLLEEILESLGGAAAAADLAADWDDAAAAATGAGDHDAAVAASLSDLSVEISDFDSMNFAVKQISTGKVLARISTVKPGDLEHASVSIYCYMHGCKKMKLFKNLPSQLDILMWVARGIHITASHDKAGKRQRHCAMWPH